MSIEIKIPDIGDDKLPVIELLVAVGDKVEKDDSLMILESDKAAVEVPAPETGVIESLSVKVGDSLGTGDIAGVISGGTTTTESATKTPNADEQKAPAEMAKVSETKAESTDAAASTASKEVDIVIPDIGDSQDVPVIEVLVSVGDQVGVESGLITLESDKASMDVPAEFAGKITSLSVKVGDQLNSGDVIGKILVEATSAQEEPANSVEPKSEPKVEPVQSQDTPAPAKTAPVAQAVDEKLFAKAHASPSVRKFARELGANLGVIKGTGRKGRITKEDVTQLIKSVMTGQASAPSQGSAAVAGIPQVPAPDYAKFGSVTEQKLSRINVLTGKHMTACWLNIPHVTQNDEADITDLEIFRKSLKAEAEKLGVRVSMLSFLMKAVVSGMKQLPKFNSSLSADGESLILKDYFNIGIAVDTPNGLVVPVIRDVDQKSIYDLSRDLMEISKKARDGKLTPSDLQGGCMTISSLGGIGGGHFTPIVNGPEVAILGVGRSKMQPVWDGSAFVARNILPLSLSYDHRVIDGADGARFTQFLSTVLSDAKRLLL